MTTTVATAHDGALVDVEAFRSMRGAERDTAMMRVEREIRRLQALRAALITEVATSASYTDDAHCSVRSWLQAVTNAATATAVAGVQTARMLAALPVLAAAAAAGDIGPDQLRLLARLHANDRCREQLPDSDALLTGHARRLTVRDFAVVCQRWQGHADPDGVHRDHDNARRSRHATVRRTGACGILHAEGDALNVDMMNEILDAHAHNELLDDLARRTTLHGDDAGSHPLPRTASQRRFDALQRIFFKAAGATASTTREPLVNIVCTEDVLAQAIRDHITGHASPSAQRSDRMRLCETVSGAPVDPADLAVAALTGQVRRVVTDSAGRVIDLGRRRRLFTGAAREAVLLSGDRCTHPGCEHRAGFLQIDHLQAWGAREGPTDPFNGGPNCPHHNVAKHRRRFTVHRDETGWHHYRPDGSEIAPRCE